MVPVGPMHERIKLPFMLCHTLRQRLVLLALLVTLWCMPSLALAQDVRSLDATMASVAAELAQRFPPVTGEVIKVELDQVFLSLGARDNLIEGTQLVLFREGEPLKHPTTGETLGRVEVELGIVTVVQVAERYAIATLTQPTGQQSIQIGDKVRITAGRLSVGMLPLINQTRQTVPTEVVVEALQRALEASERFRVVSRDRVSIWLLNRGVRPEGVIAPELLPELGQALQASYLLMPLVKDLRGTMIVEALLLSPTRPQTPVATASAILSAATLVQRSLTPPVQSAEAARPVPAPPAPAAPPPSAPQAAAPKTAPEPAPTKKTKPEPKQNLRGVFKTSPQQRPDSAEWNIAESLTKLRDFPELLTAIDGGDIDGDGTIEVAIVMGARISLYRFDGEKFDLLDTFTSSRQGKLLSVQLLRLTGPHPIGIVVNQQVATGGMESFILVLQTRKLAVWQEYLYEILLAVDTDGDGVKETLWGQPFDANDFFRSGAARRYLMGHGTLTPRESVAVPYLFRATGAALVKLSTTGQRDLVFIDMQNHLRVSRNTEELWKSPERVGGNYTYGEVEKVMSRDMVKTPFIFEPLPLAVDLDGDGVEEVLIARNISRLGFLPTLNQYAGGDILLLREENYGYSLAPISPQFNGIVSGIIAVPGTPPAILIAVTKEKGLFSRGGETTLFLSRMQ